MKKGCFLILCVLAFYSCKNVEEPEVENYDSYTSVGETVTSDHILSVEEMTRKFGEMQLGDTITAKFKANVASVCKNKGCWMNLDLGNGQEATVKFKDYSIFMPKNIEQKEVVVNGKAFVSVASVEEQRHFAEDAGKTPEEIAAITEPKITLSFLADGVLIEQ